MRHHAKETDPALQGVLSKLIQVDAGAKLRPTGGAFDKGIRDGEELQKVKRAQIVDLTIGDGGHSVGAAFRAADCQRWAWLFACFGDKQNVHVGMLRQGFCLARDIPRRR